MSSNLYKFTLLLLTIVNISPFAPSLALHPPPPPSTSNARKLSILASSKDGSRVKKQQLNNQDNMEVYGAQFFGGAAEKEVFVDEDE